MPFAQRDDGPGSVTLHVPAPEQPCTPTCPPTDDNTACTRDECVVGPPVFAYDDFSESPMGDNTSDGYGGYYMGPARAVCDDAADRWWSGDLGARARAARVRAF